MTINMCIARETSVMFGMFVSLETSVMFVCLACLCRSSLLLGVLIKHHGLSEVVDTLVRNDFQFTDTPQRGFPRSITEICRIIHHGRKTLIKVTVLDI